MIVRLGYVAISLMLKDCSTAKTVTVKTYTGMEDEESRLNKVRKVAKQNIENTLRVLRHNVAHNIFIYRFSSQTIPLATHPLLEKWDYLKEFTCELRELGDYCKENSLRVSAHPDHYTLINSPDEKIVANSIKDLEYHAGLFSTMGLDFNTKMVMHIGGMYKAKEASIKRFKENFNTLPDHLKKRLMLENDDRSYSASDVLNICHELKVPMVLDVHHHMVVNENNHIGDLLPDIYGTWNGHVPKIHFSSPKSSDKIRPHAEDIYPDDFYQFLQVAREYNQDIDVMLEAKNKDIALFNLMKEMEKRKEVTIIDGASFQI